MKYLHLGGHDNVCFDAMLPLDVVPLRRQSLSDSTPVSSSSFVFQVTVKLEIMKRSVSVSKLYNFFSYKSIYRRPLEIRYIENALMFLVYKFFNFLF